MPGSGAGQSVRETSCQDPRQAPKHLPLAWRAALQALTISPRWRESAGRAWWAQRRRISARSTRQLPRCRSMRWRCALLQPSAVLS